MSQPRPRLIGSGTSPFVRKVRAALLEKGVEHDFESSPAWNAASPANVLNPLQKVPVLLWPGREPLFDSRVIAQAIDTWVPDPALLPADPERRLQALQIEALADGVGDAVALRTQEDWRRPEARSAYWIARQEAKIAAGLQALDAAMADWLPRQGEAPGLPALAAGAATGFAVFWQASLVRALHLPRLDELERGLAERRSWQLTRPALPPGAGSPQL